MQEKFDRGSTLIEIVIAIVILGIAGVALINAMTSSNSAANKATSKTVAFYTLTSAADAYSSFPYSNNNCSQTMNNPYASSQAAGGVDKTIKVKVQTLINNRLSSSQSEWRWVTCGVASEWSTLSPLTLANLGDSYAGVQRIVLGYQLGASACADAENAQTNRCLTRTILKSDNNRNTPFASVGSFRVWPTNALNLVTTETRFLGLKVVGVPSSTDQIAFIVSSVSAGLSVSPKNDVGVNVTAGSTVSGASPFSFRVQACDVTISIARSNPATTDGATACAQSGAFLSAQTTVFINVYQKLTLVCPTPGCLNFSGNVGSASSVYQLSATGGNGQTITFSTSADPAAFVVTPDGKFNWTSTAPASSALNTYDNLIPADVPITISQPGLTSTTSSVKVTIFSSPRFISPAQPPLPSETITFNAGSTSPYLLRAVGGNPTMSLAFSTPTSSPVTLAFVNNLQGISTANMTLKSGQNVGRYNVSVTLSGAGWPTANNPTFVLPTVVRPVVNDPGSLEGAIGTTGSVTLTCLCTGSASNTYRITTPTTGFSLTTSGLLSWTNSLPQGTYLIPVTVTSRVSGEDFVSATRTVKVTLIDPFRATANTSSCTNFRNSSSTNPCRITITYSAGTGSGLGLKLATAPTSTNGFLWSTPAGNTTLPYPSSSGATSVTVSLYRKASGSGIFCGSSVSSGTITITVQDAGGTATATFNVSVTC